MYLTALISVNRVVLIPLQYVFMIDPKVNPEAVKYDEISIQEVIDQKLAAVDRSLWKTLESGRHSLSISAGVT